MVEKYVANLLQLNGPKTNHGTSQIEEGLVSKI